ncbi:hypothetical protein D3C77_709570 [compost metagenome]
MQDDRFEPRRHLDRADGVTAVDDVGRVRPCPERLFAGLKTQGAATLEAIADTVSFRANRPRLGEEARRGSRLQAVVVQPRHHPQFNLTAQ